MNTIDHLALALDACLDRPRADGRNARAVVPAYPQLVENATLAASVSPLVELAIGLEALPKAPDPEPAFRLRLAAELFAAPAPSCLRMPVAASTAATAMARSAGDLVQVLEDGIDALRSGGVPAGAILARHPDVAVEVEPLLELAAALGTLPAIPGPAEAYRQRLAAELAAAPAPRSLEVRPAREGIGFFGRLWRNTAFSAAAAATVVLFVASGITYASADALPGDWLYPVKRVAERLSVWLAPDGALELHLRLAERRLDEAVTVTAYAGDTLAAFSGEVTAALGAADHRLAASEPRRKVTDPLLVWLLGARGELVGGRTKLPPTAWRASLALVDEAINALQSGGPLAEAPVPRLGDARAMLLRAASPVVTRIRPTARQLTSGGGASGRGAPGAARRPSSRVAAARGPGGGGVPPATAPLRSEPSNAQVPPPPAGSGGEQRQKKEPDRPNAPTLTPAPTDVPPTPTLAPVQPSPGPATSVPTQPVDPPATPTAPPATVPANQAPEITEVTCMPEKLLPYGEATCTVTAVDVEGDALTYKWSVNPLHAEFIKDDRRQVTLGVDSPGSGYGPLELPITVEVTDSAGNATEGKTKVIVVERLEHSP